MPPASRNTRRIIATALEVLGVLMVALALYSVAHWAGLLVAGLGGVVFGIASDPSPPERK